MLSFTKSHPFIYSFYCIICVLPIVISIPVITKDDPFDTFIEFLSYNNCSMPKEVELPFSVTDSVPFSYLKIPLQECQSSDAVKENNEAKLLCREVFELIQNITCFDYKLNDSKIESGKLSTDVCKDFAVIQDVIPAQKEFLSKKFSDDIICRVMCTGKYEFLCKTLLWGYNIQAKLKNAILEKNEAEKVEENLNSHPNNNEIPDEETSSALEKPKKALNEDNEISLSKATSDLEKENKALDKDKNLNSEMRDAESEIHNSDKNIKTENNLSASEDKKKEPNNLVGTTEKIDSQKIDSGKSDKPIESSKVIVIPPKAEVTSKSSNDLNEKNQTIQDNKSNDLDKNKSEIPSKILNKNDEVNVPTIAVNISASNADGNEKSDIATQEQGEDSKIDVANSKEKIKNGPNSTVPKTEEENDLKKSDQENVIPDKAKETQGDFDSKGEDPKENEIPNGESYSNLSEPTVPLIFPDKNEDFEQQPELKDPEQYNDSENDGDYAKQEYDTAFNPGPKKESNMKNTLNDGSSQFSSGSNMQISNENFLGHESDINRNFLPARNDLLDQEDSHFFFYFLTIVLVLMAGYLIFHNKQKIIALIVEGRHERRRRSHGAGYKKLETK